MLKSGEQFLHPWKRCFSARKKCGTFVGLKRSNSGGEFEICLADDEKKMTHGWQISRLSRDTLSWTGQRLWRSGGGMLRRETERRLWTECGRERCEFGDEGGGSMVASDSIFTYWSTPRLATLRGIPLTIPAAGHSHGHWTDRWTFACARVCVSHHINIPSRGHIFIFMFFFFISFIYNFSIYEYFFLKWNVEKMLQKCSNYFFCKFAWMKEVWCMKGRM